MHGSLLQDALPIVLATAWELAVCATTRVQYEPQASTQGQQEGDAQHQIDDQSFSKLLYVQACGHLAGHVLSTVSCEALCETSAGAALVSQLDTPMNANSCSLAIVSRDVAL